MLLTDQKGLYTADPRSNPQAELIKDVYGIDDALRAIAGDSVSGLGTGGMSTKLQAADVACRAGIDTIIADVYKRQDADRFHVPDALPES